MVLDKTGTLTVGRPAVVEVAAAPGEDPAEVLRLCASADQVSPHVLARAVTAEARARNLPLALPHDVDEEPGRGVRATVEGRRVEVGKRPPTVDHGPAVGPDGAQPCPPGRDRGRLADGRGTG